MQACQRLERVELHNMTPSGHAKVLRSIGRRHLNPVDAIVFSTLDDLVLFGLRNPYTTVGFGTPVGGPKDEAIIDWMESSESHRSFS